MAWLCQTNLSSSEIDMAGAFITFSRLISVEDVRNYLSHFIYILIFDFFFKFYIICQTPDSNIFNKMLEGGIMVSERQMRFNVNL